MASSSRIDSLKKQYADNQKRYFAALANEYRKAGDLAQSIALCRQHLPEQPNHISGHIVFGQALFEAGELEESRSVFETALTLDPENLIALRHLGDIASRSGDALVAREWYTRILHADPRNEEIQTLLRALPDTAAPEAPSAAAPDSGPSAEISSWAADLAADEGHAAPDGVPEQTVSHNPPAAVVAPESGAAIDAFAPPPALDVDAPGHAGARRVSGRDIPLPPPPFDLPTPAADDVPFDLDFGTGNDMGLGVHLGAAPPEPPGGTPPIGMEAIYEAERVTLHGEPAADVTPSMPRPDYGADAGDGPLSSHDDFTAEPLGGRNISEEMQAIFGAPGGQSEAAAVGGDEMGIEHMEFRAPERDAVDAAFDDDFAARAGEAAAASGATPQAFVTETMAELYLQQGFREEALNVYRQLLAASPHDRSLRERVQRLESGASASVDISEAPQAAAVPSAPVGPRTARDFFEALATRRAPSREPMAEPMAEPTGEPASFERGGAGGANAADTLASELAGPPHTSEPLAFEGSTATGLLSSHGADVSEGDVAAGAPVTATPVVDPPDADAVYHPELGDAAVATPPEPRSSVPDMLAAAFAGEGNGAAFAAGFAEGSLDRLFGGRAVPSEDEVAAASLASAFTGEHEAPPSGKPTRPADGELSLDRVFRTPQAGTPVTDASAPAAPAATSRPSGTFSFDQFFADAGGASEAPAAPSADPGEVAASDIEQFNSWLEGLKKK